jgi:hypothetical protein
LMRRLSRAPARRSRRRKSTIASEDEERCS